MGMRELKRSIARQRLLDLGVEKVNRQMGKGGVGRISIRKAAKTRHLRAALARERKEQIPLWKDVLYGDSARQWNRARKAGRIR